jgi:hypothetical protein
MNEELGINAFAPVGVSFVVCGMEIANVYSFGCCTLGKMIIQRAG